MAIERARPGSKSRDRFETGDISFLERVRKGFLAIAERESSRFIRISCNAGIENIQETAKNILIERGF